MSVHSFSVIGVYPVSGNSAQFASLRRKMVLPFRASLPFPLSPKSRTPKVTLFSTSPVRSADSSYKFPSYSSQRFTCSARGSPSILISFMPSDNVTGVVIHVSARASDRIVSVPCHAPSASGIPVPSSIPAPFAVPEPSAIPERSAVPDPSSIPVPALSPIPLTDRSAATVRVCCTGYTRSDDKKTSFSVRSLTYPRTPFQLVCVSSVAAEENTMASWGSPG